MWEAFGFSLLILAVCVALLCIKLLFGKEFVSTHIDENQTLREKGICCALEQDKMARKIRNPHKKNI